MRAPGVLFALLVPLALASCGTPPDPLARETAPERFAVDLTVLAPEDPTFLEGDPPPLARRPARYIVEPDRGLHAGEGRGVTPEYYPPLIRRLTRDQMNELWRIVRDSSLIGAASTEQAGAVFEAYPDQPVAILGVVLERKWLFVRTPLDGASPVARDVEAIGGRLGELAWVRE